MFLNRKVASSVAAALVLSAIPFAGSVAKADSYSPGDFLVLDLNQAVLSPKPLGPPARFEAVPIEARSDGKAGLGSEAAAQQAPTAETAAAGAVPVVKTSHTRASDQRATARRHGSTRSRVVRSRGNPLDAYASDTRIQVWPCRSGGICNWRK